MALGATLTQDETGLEFQGRQIAEKFFPLFPFQAHFKGAPLDAEAND